jgi:hypothetical protein
MSERLHDKAGTCSPTECLGIFCMSVSWPEILAGLSACAGILPISGLKKSNCVPSVTLSRFPYKGPIRILGGIQKINIKLIPMTQAEIEPGPSAVILSGTPQWEADAHQVLQGLYSLRLDLVHENRMNVQKVKKKVDRPAHDPSWSRTKSFCFSFGISLTCYPRTNSTMNLKSTG